MAQDLEGLPIHLLSITTHQLVEGPRVASLGQTNQCSVLLLCVDHLHASSRRWPAATLSPRAARSNRTTPSTRVKAGAARWSSESFVRWRSAFQITRSARAPGARAPRRAPASASLAGAAGE